MPVAPRSFLIIQTSFIGDVILATALVEKLHQQFPDAAIDFLLRKGNETLLIDHPFLRKVIVWDKKNHKLRNLLAIIATVRKSKYDHVINVHRFFSSGLITAFSNATVTTGFDKNPLSFFFSKTVSHNIKEGVHETDRNQQLIQEITNTIPAMPALYPSPTNFSAVAGYKQLLSPSGKYLCIAPTSVWFTKQFPAEKWTALLNRNELRSYNIFLLGAPGDDGSCEGLRASTTHAQVFNLAGKLSFLESAALMKDAYMNYVNDSAPMHLASAMNAPVTAIYCSTVPAFGFGPLSHEKYVVETREPLTCRPCGLHGHRTCPEGHFKCALTIDIEAVASTVKSKV